MKPVNTSIQRSRRFGPRRHLVIMLKEPHPGRVKTRLGREIGMVPAAWWFRHQSKALLRRLYHPERWTTWLAVSPDLEGLQSRVWPGNFNRVPQGRGDLGQRMARVFHSLPSGPAMIIGSDIPGISATSISKGFAALAPGAAVLGPAVDGGFWLIGLPRNSTPMPAQLFQNVRWSGPYALSDTQITLKGLKIRHLEALRDVDCLADLTALKSE